MIQKFIIFIILSITWCTSFGQNSTGCRLTNGKIYSPQTGTALLGATLIPLYLGIPVPVYASPEISTTNSNCPGWASSVVPTGNSCATTTLLGTGLLGGYLLATNSGEEVSYNFILCPIDDYTPAFLLGFAGLGFILIKRKNIF